MVLGGGAVSYERGTHVQRARGCFEGRWSSSSWAAGPWRASRVFFLHRGFVVTIIAQTKITTQRFRITIIQSNRLYSVRAAAEEQGGARARGRLGHGASGAWLHRCSRGTLIPY